MRQPSLGHGAGEETHTLDVHWRISNSELLAQLFDYQELLERAEPPAGIGSRCVGC